MEIFPQFMYSIIYAGLNVLAFGAFVLDKYKAKTNAYRIPETTLLIFAVCGPFGALLAMQVFRHKTRHAKFFLVPFLAIIHLLLIIYLFSLRFS
jgi:uncharacterized membrane protein YsdA (DUF1294 family)